MATDQSLLVLLFLISFCRALVFESQSLVIDGRKDSTLSCYHQYAGSIRLTVELSNGTNITENSRRDIIYHTCFHIENRTLHYTVTIPSKPEYYGARVVCIAVFHDQFVNESSQPMLTLTTTSRRTVNISVGETAVYECAACSRIDWLLNGTDLNNLNMTSRDIMIMVSAADESIRVSTLSIIGRLVYNSTSIGCQALDSPEKLPDVYLYVHRLQCPETLTVKSLLMTNKQVKVNLTTHTNSSSDLVSNVATIELESLDGLNSTQREVVPSYHNQGVSFSLTLPRNRIWKTTVVRTCKFSTFNLSTHDIQNISVSSPLPGTVRVTGDFIQGSTATRVLTILYRRNDSHIFYDLVPTRLGTGNTVLVNITGVDGGTYDVFIYAVEGNGTYTLVTGEPQVIVVDSSNERPSSALHVPPPSVEYDIQRTSNGFNVTCISLVSQVTECVVVVHRKLPVAHLRVTLYVYQLGGMISDYIYVANPDDFEVAVIGNARKRRHKTPTPGWIIAVACICGFLMLASLAGVAIAAAILIHRKRVKRHTTRKQGYWSPPQPPPAGTGPSIELPGRESPYNDLPRESHKSKTTFRIASPEEEMNKEVRYRKGGLPQQQTNRLVGGSGSGNGSDAFGGTSTMQPHLRQVDMGSSSSLVTSPDDYNLSVSQSDITGNDQSRIDN